MQHVQHRVRLLGCAHHHNLLLHAQARAPVRAPLWLSSVHKALAVLSVHSSRAQARHAYWTSAIGARIVRNTLAVQHVAPVHSAGSTPHDCGRALLALPPTRAHTPPLHSREAEARLPATGSTRVHLLEFAVCSCPRSHKAAGADQQAQTNTHTPEACAGCFLYQPWTEATAPSNTAGLTGPAGAARARTCTLFATDVSMNCILTKASKSLMPV